MQIKKGTILTIFSLILFVSCGFFNSANNESSFITINTGLDISNTSRAVADNIISLKLTVTADGIMTVEQTFTDESISIEVTAGTSRTFTLQALDANDKILFSGSSTVDLSAGETVNIIIEMDLVGVYVSFDSMGGISLPAIYVVDGGIITAPSVPTRSGYTFVGWYSGAGLIIPWVFDSSTVTANITLYAKWQLVVLFSDDFSTDGDLNGSTPDSGGNWSVTAALTVSSGIVDTSTVVAEENVLAYATLADTLGAGQTLTLTFNTENLTNGIFANLSWAGISLFSGGSGGTEQFFIGNIGTLSGWGVDVKGVSALLDPLVDTAAQTAVFTYEHDTGDWICSAGGGSLVGNASAGLAIDTVRIGAESLEALASTDGNIAVSSIVITR